MYGVVVISDVRLISQIYNDILGSRSNYNNFIQSTYLMYGVVKYELLANNIFIYVMLLLLLVLKYMCTFSCFD